MPAVDLSVIIVSFNTREYLKGCLTSIFESAPFSNFEVIVVENSSQDGSVEMVKAIFPQVRLIEPGTNLGFAKANNLGAKFALCRYLLFLNPDTIITPTTLGKMVEFMDHNPKAGAATCMVRNEDGTPQLLSTRRKPTISVFFLESLGINRRFPANFIYRRYIMANWKREASKTVDVITGAFFFVRTDVFTKVSGFDERFFMYIEDLELSFRIWQSGQEIWFNPNAEIIHFGGKASSAFPYLAMVRGSEAVYRYFLKLNRKIIAELYRGILICAFFLLSWESEFIGAIFDRRSLLEKHIRSKEIVTGLLGIKA